MSTAATETRALELLGTGVTPEAVANALGVTVSRISQLLSQEDFAARVAELRFKNLQKHTIRDNSYDELEDDLVSRLRDLMPLMHRPMEVLKAIQVINAAKRRGQSAPDSIIQQQTIVQLNVPTKILQQFTTNINNQVIVAGSQDLNTMQSGLLIKQLEGVKQNDSITAEAVTSI
jgi:predicted transcriptional regulator